jgi:maleamate amidohydrolase
MNPEPLWSGVIDAPTAALMAGRTLAPFGGRRLAVVAVDLYDLVYDGGPAPVPDLIESFPASCGEFAWRALPPTIELFACARENGVPVIHVTYDTRLETDPRTFHPTNRKRRQPDLSLYAIKQELAPLPGELVIYKKRASAFFGTPLAAFLNELKIDALILVGESTSGCVRSSVVEGWSFGYPVAVVADCVFDRCDLIQKASLFDMHLKYAEVMDLGTACAHLRAGRH